MTRFRISLAILLVLLGISMGSMAAVRKPLLESDCDEFTAELKDLQSSLQFLIQEEGFSFLMLF